MNLNGYGAVVATGVVETDAVTAFAWVRLAAGSDGVQTVLANRASGCGVGAPFDGFALLINSWGTSDGKLQVWWRVWGGVHSRLAWPWSWSLVVVAETFACGGHGVCSWSGLAKRAAVTTS